MAIGGSCLTAQGSIAPDMPYEGLRSVVAVIVQKNARSWTATFGGLGQDTAEWGLCASPKAQQSLKANYPEIFQLPAPQTCSYGNELASDQSSSLLPLTDPSMPKSHSNI